MEIKKNNQFNNLEKAVLQWFIENYKDSILTSQIKAAILKERKWTKVGFYVKLEVAHNLEPIDFSILGQKKDFPIKGPDIESKDVEFGGGALLWGNDGYIDCIELFASGNFFREHVENFKLK